MKRVKLVAHRGYSKFYPENTLISFKEALKLDIDAIETDVHMTRDGELVLMHDHTLERTTDMRGLIRDTLFSEVRRADAGRWKDEKFKGAEVPTLRELLELLKDRKDIELIVEMKDYPADCGAFGYLSCDKTVAMLEEYGMAERCYINSASGDILNYVSAKFPQYRIEGFSPVRLHGEQFSEGLWRKCFSVCLFNISFDPVTGAKDNSKAGTVPPQSAYDRVAAQGAERWYYYKEDVEEMLKTALERGATGFTSNDPVRCNELLRKLGAR